MSDQVGEFGAKEPPDAKPELMCFLGLLNRARLLPPHPVRISVDGVPMILDRSAKADSVAEDPLTLRGHGSLLRRKPCAAGTGSGRHPATGKDRRRPLAEWRCFPPRLWRKLAFSDMNSSSPSEPFRPFDPASTKSERAKNERKQPGIFLTPSLQAQNSGLLANLQKQDPARGPARTVCVRPTPMRSG